MVDAAQAALFRRLRSEGATALEAAAVLLTSGAVELAVRGQLRDSHGRFASTGDVAAHIKAHDTASLHAHDTASRDAKAKLAADRKNVYRGKEHGFKAGSVTVRKGDLTDRRARAARVTAAQERAVAIGQEGSVNPAQLNRAVLESKLYTASEFAAVQHQLDDLKGELDHEGDEQARATMASHIALIVIGILIAAALGGAGLPALLAAGATATPQIAQEISDFHVVEKGRGREWLSHPVQETEHVAQGLRQERRQRLHSPKSSPARA